MSSKSKIKIAFISPYPFDTVGGQRFRYEQYLHILTERNYTVAQFSFLTYSTYSILYKKGFFLRKFLGIVLGYVRRCLHLFKILSYDFVFIYREATPLGPPMFEWIISRVLKKKIIYDFDDAIWLPSTSQENSIIKILKYPEKVSLICKWSYKVSIGNKYLRDFALKYNSNAIINPTTIDTERYHNEIKVQETNKIIIGWTGTHSTLVYLDIIYPVLKKLDGNFDFVFEVIADKEVHFDLKNFSFKKWKKETEIQDLLNFNIGVMPLQNDEWSKGKCGFKALQYMSLGIPAVVSPVGINNEIISEGMNGFCCQTEEQWFEKLSLLISDEKLRVNMGKKAIEKVKWNYSKASNESNFLRLFN